MENNLHINFEEKTKENKDQQGIQKKEEKSFYDKVLEERKRLENKDIAIETVAKNKLKFSKSPEALSTPSDKKKHYNYEEVFDSATKYFNGDTLAANVWMNKYALKDSDDKFFELTPDDMHKRLAKEIARIEKKYINPMSEEDLFDVLKDFKYIIPAGSPMAGIGNDNQISSLSNCFVIGNEGDSDSYGGILKIDQEQVQLMKRRGGVGHDLTHIRPKGSPVKNTALTSTGVVPFMDRYSNSTREVAQDGRRGALMLSIGVKHPDSEDFIDAKMKEGKVTGANISIKLDDEFMNAVKNNIPYKQQYPVNSDSPKYVKEINPGDLWEKIVRNAWTSAEPGILFWDTVIRESIPDAYSDYGFKTVSTNPCGEIPLCPYDSCRLLALNLYSYVEEPFTKDAYFNGDKFTAHARIAQRIMDDIIDLEIEKIDLILTKIDADPEADEIKHVERNLWKKIREKSIQGRRTGIGITAEGDMLAALGLQYGSKDAITFSTEAHKLLAIEVYRASVDLAEERGSFEVFDATREVNNPFIQRIKKHAPRVYDKMVKVGRRNISLLTIAPTGSISICTQTTSGIEPVFMVAYKRRRKVNPNDKNVTINFIDDVGDAWEEYNVFHPKFETWLKINGYNIDEVKAKNDDELNKIIKQSPYYKATSGDINWVSKVKMQGDIQKWVDHSISVTVNIPENATEELVSEIYLTAWERGCKGMTIYREGSRSGVLVRGDNKEDKDEFQDSKAPSRPKTIEADIIRFQNNYEKWLAVIGKINDKPYEVFTGKAEDFYLPPYVDSGWVTKKKQKGERSRYDFEFNDKQGYRIVLPALSRSFEQEFWNYAKLISGVLRHGMPLTYVIGLISNLNVPEDNINTWKNGVVRALKRYIPDGTDAIEKICPVCKEETVVYEDGCLICKSCGHTKCS
ncbi:MAG: adenosylcobalamin-dependent ribonucleoside-diphosphate reductase [Bacteroidetes bacterium]|nr:adenosylcobalamin-dependent ribonucleoside-diphosphate reductase [Bacteroidota bacterium]MBL6943205.1 adenosylcobalamin-dependent ribonucleoside-diphosphate reductase [Bacteroidales bacterium]